MTPRDVRPGSRGFSTFFVFTAPALAMLALFFAWPVGSALYHSFYDWDGFRAGRFVGLDNYRQLFADAHARASALNIAQFIAARLALNLAFPMLAALLLFHMRSRRAAGAYRTLFTIPMVVPLMVVLLVWKFVYHPHDGLLNHLLDAAGLAGWRHVWLGEFETALYAVIGIGFPWVTGLGLAGFALLIYLAGLQAIPAEIFDALAVDGVGLGARLARIELPLIAGPIRLIVVLTTINTLKSYVPVMILTNGGPSDASLVPGLYLYQSAFYYDRFGYASAIGVVMTAFLVTITWINNRAMRAAG
jgi:raffinose/stachyose/melibiose transport system permease protein